MNYATSLKEVLAGISVILKEGRLFNVLEPGNKSILTRVQEVLNINTESVDVQEVTPKIKEAISFALLNTIIATLINFLIGLILLFRYIGLYSVLKIVLALVSAMFGVVIPIVAGILIAGAVLLLVEKHSLRWNNTVLKILVILSVLGIAGGFINTLGIIFSFRAYSLVRLWRLVSNLFTLYVNLITLQALLKARPYSVEDSSGLNMDNISNFNNSHDYVNTHHENYNPVPMFECPICKGQIPHGENPCRHCGAGLQW